MGGANMLLKRPLALLVLGFIAINFYGCIFFAAGLQDSYKASQKFNASYSDAIDAVKAGLESKGIESTKSVVQPDVTALRGVYNGQGLYIEILKVSDTETNIKVRVGTSEAGKKDAQDILDAIAQRLPANQ
jgi:hypothetical protein